MGQALGSYKWSADNFFFLIPGRYKISGGGKLVYFWTFRQNQALCYILCISSFNDSCIKWRGVRWLDQGHTAKEFQVECSIFNNQSLPYATHWGNCAETVYLNVSMHNPTDQSFLPRIFNRCTTELCSSLPATSSLSLWSKSSLWLKEIRSLFLSWHFHGVCLFVCFHYFICMCLKENKTWCHLIIYVFIYFCSNVQGVHKNSKLKQQSFTQGVFKKGGNI